MALTLRRWVLALLVGTAVLAAAYLPPRAIEDARWPRAFMAMSLGRPLERTRLAIAAERWGRLSELEALRHSPPRGPGPEVLFRSPAPPAVRRLADSMIRAIWQHVPRADSLVRLRVAVWFSGNTPPDVGTAQARAQVVLPEQTDGRTCLVLLPQALRVGSDTLTRQWRAHLRRVVAPALAPCALRAALGPPGPEVARWLKGRGYDLALSIDWAVGGNLVMDDWWYDQFEDRLPDVRGLTARLIGVLPPAYAGTLDTPACLGGDDRRCLAAVLTPAARDSAARGITLPSPFGAPQVTLGLNQQRFLSDLIRAHGLAAVRRFWTSPAPVPEAFGAAFEETLPHWTRSWMARNSGTVDLGASLNLPGIASGLVLIGVFVALVAWGAQGREIG